MFVFRKWASNASLVMTSLARPNSVVRSCPGYAITMASPNYSWEQAELIGLPAVAGGAVGARVELHVLDEILHAPARAIDLFVEHFCPAWQIGDDEAYVAALLAGFDAGDDLAGLAPAGCGITGLKEAPHFSRF